MNTQVQKHTGCMSRSRSKNTEKGKDTPKISIPWEKNPNWTRLIINHHQENPADCHKLFADSITAAKEEGWKVKTDGGTASGVYDVLAEKYFPTLDLIQSCMPARLKSLLKVWKVVYACELF